MKIKIATVCSGIGSPEVAIKNLGIDHSITFACEIDKYARETYLANHDCETMYQDMTTESWEGEKYYSDLFIGGIPCQSFSLAGKRLGELDPRGLLFFDFLRYVKNQQPKYFIIENVKGLLSDAGGETFQNWIHLLGQSVNGNPFFFPHEDSLMYNLHWQVLNTKDYGLPQNRERVFLVGIRNDLPNSFVFPKGIPLKLRLKDILEEVVDEKYYLSEKIIKGFTNHSEKMKEKGNGFSFKPIENPESEISSTLTARYYKMGIDDNYIKVKSATKCGYEIATEGDSINLSNINSETRRGRVGEQVAQTLTTSCNKGVMVVGFERTEEAKIKRSKSIKENGIDTGNFSDRKLKLKEQDYSDTILANPNHQKEGLIAIGAMRGRNPDNPNDRSKGGNYQQTLEINENGTSNCLSTVQKDNLVVENKIIELNSEAKHQQDLVQCENGISRCLVVGSHGNSKHFTKTRVSDFRIRKLTPLEAFRLQGFDDSFVKPVSNSQLYKQAGNTISVNVIQAILKNLLK